MQQDLSVSTQQDLSLSTDSFYLTKDSAHNYYMCLQGGQDLDGLLAARGATRLCASAAVDVEVLFHLILNPKPKPDTKRRD